MAQNIPAIGSQAGPYITDPYMLGVYRYGIATESDEWLLCEDDLVLYRT